MKTWPIVLCFVIVVLAIPTGLYSEDISEKMAKNEEKYKKYNQEVISAITEHWSVPELQKIEKLGLRAIIQVLTDERGKIVNYRWIKKSRNESFDSACAKAIEDTKKLPHPPASIALSIVREGLHVQFMPGSVSLSLQPVSCPALKDKMKNEDYKKPSSYSKEPYIYEISSIIKKKYKMALYRESSKISNHLTGMADRQETVVGFSIDENGDIKNMGLRGFEWVICGHLG